MPDVFVKPKKKSPPIEKPQQIKPPEDTKPTPDTAQPEERRNPLSMLTTFCRNPKGIQLVGQDPDEEILLFIRQDFITNVPWIVATVLFAILPLFVPSILSFVNISLAFIPDRIAFLLMSFYYLLLIGYAFANFLTWFYIVGIVTNKKAVDIDFHNLSSIHVGSVSLADTNNAKYKQAGFLQSFFDYGDIIITIEATQENFLFERAPRPAQIADMLGDLIGEK